MATVSTVLAGIAGNITSRATIDPDAIGAALLDFADSGTLPADELLRAVILDAEAAAFVVLGGSPNSTWIATLNACRVGALAPAQVNDVHRAVVLDNASALGQLRRAVRGRHRVAVAG